MIELENVVKDFARPWYRPGPAVRALDGVSLRVSAGLAIGIVGLNGAGKSTLIRILLGYLKTTSGHAAIGGDHPRHYVERNGIAYVPERVSIPRHWTVRSALRTFAMIGDVGNDAWDQVEIAIERLGLTKLADRRIGALSKGNLQRVGIAQALLGDRRLMVLDEPTEGLDPVWTIELRNIIAEWRGFDQGRTVIMASHNLPEVERLTDRVVLLHNGRVEAARNGGADQSLEEWFLSSVAALEEGRP